MRDEKDQFAKAKQEILSKPSSENVLNDQDPLQQT